MEKLDAAQRAYIRDEAIKSRHAIVKKNQCNCDLLLKVISCNVNYLCNRSSIGTNQITNNTAQTNLINETITCLEKLKKAVNSVQDPTQDTDND